MKVLDIEVYQNYFLVCIKELETGNIEYFEQDETRCLDKYRINNILKGCTTVGFNSLNYDLPLIWYALKMKTATPESIKNLSDDIILGKLSGMRVIRNAGLPELPPTWDHIDLIEIAPGQSSLKIYGGRLGAESLIDLPYTPGAVLTDAQKETVRDYCINDLALTEALYRRLEKQIALRVEMSKSYEMDLRSKSDAQIAETVIVHELGIDKWKRAESPSKVRYSDPKIISFNGDQLSGIFGKLKNETFSLLGNGAVAMPGWLKDTKIKIGSTDYNMGIGGLHSCEKNQVLKADHDMILIDLDVASYYPTIILQQRLAPKSLGVKFLKVYESIYLKRLEAKRSGNKTVADTYKIVLNGAYGKLGSKFSALYSPDLMLQVTLTGQLALLMLIERLEASGISVVSANTDGIVIYTSRQNENTIENIAFDWMLETSYELERTDYKLIASRDVNNYFAVKLDGSTKRKGCFTESGIAKNPDREIVYTAVCEYFAKGTPVSKTITECSDLRQFVMLRTVKGGAVWNGEYIGKAVRWYYSKDGADLRYKINSNLVPNSTGCRPAMKIGIVPDDLDHARYIDDAEQMIKELEC